MKVCRTIELESVRLHSNYFKIKYNLFVCLSRGRKAVESQSNQSEAEDEDDDDDEEEEECPGVKSGFYFCFVKGLRNALEQN
jgi:hypothetical protein